jgi:hypothetical protein
MPTLFQFPSGGALTIADSDVFYFGQNGTEYQLPFSSIKDMFGNVQAAELSIPTASVLTLNATPLDIVAAPGAGYAIEVISATYGATYNSVAYATYTQLQLITAGATIAQYNIPSGLTFTASGKWQMYQYSSAFGATSTQVIENAALQVKVATGNPTAGNSDIKVYVLYRIITL